MKHDSEAYQAIQRDLAQAYGKYGQSKSGEEAWRSDPPEFASTTPDPARYPIRARLRQRKAWMRKLNGWLQMAIFAALFTLTFFGGFVMGALWELQQWVGRR